MYEEMCASMFKDVCMCVGECVRDSIVLNAMMSMYTDTHMYL